MSAVQSAPLLSRRVAILGVLVLLATAFGGWRAVTLASTPRLAANSFQVGGVTYTVTHAEQVAGLSDADLSGMSHGIQGLVNDASELVRVSVLVSAGKSAATYHPDILKIYKSGSPKAVSAVGGSLSPGKLQPHGQIEGQLSFVLPRDGSTLTLRAGTDPRVVSLLQLDAATPGATGGSHATHSTSGSTK